MNDPLFWLYADNYRTYNIDVARKLDSIYAAILLSEMASRYRFHRDRGDLFEDEKHGGGWFYFTSEDVENRTLLSRKNQDSAIAVLLEKGLIEKVILGVPARRYFRLNEQEIDWFFFSKRHSNLSETDKLDCPKRTNWNDRNGQTDAQDAYITEEQKAKNKTNTPATAGQCARSATPSVSSRLAPPSASKTPDASNSRSEAPPSPNNGLPIPTTPNKKKAQPRPVSASLTGFGAHVKLEPEKYEELCAQHGAALVIQIIDEMNDYLSATGKSGYRDYAAAIRQWIRRRKDPKNNTGGNGNGNVKQQIRDAQLQRWIDANGDPNNFSNIIRFD